MRILTSIVIVTALVLCLGCAKKESAPVEEVAAPAEAQVDAEPIAEEDFEAGDVGDAMTVGDDEAAPEEDGESSGH